LHINFAGALLMPAVYLIAIRYGALGLAAGWLVSVPLLLAFTIHKAKPHIGFTVRQLASAVSPGLAAAAGMAVATWAADYAVMTYMCRDMPAPLHLALLTLTGGVSYVALLWFGSRPTALEVINLMVRRTPQTELKPSTSRSR
jgi:hypothetical protein